jgi:hypothetical protein
VKLFDKWETEINEALDLLERHVAAGWRGSGNLPLAPLIFMTSVMGAQLAEHSKRKLPHFRGLSDKIHREAITPLAKTLEAYCRKPERNDADRRELFFASIHARDVLLIAAKAAKEEARAGT